MTKLYKEITAGISSSLAKMRKEIPDVMNAFSALSQNATKEGILDKKTKELIALAIGVSTRCDGCIGFHAHTLVKLGTTRQELLEMLSMAIYMGGGPSLMYAADALRAFEEFSEQK
ncbi:MAG: carboxymuconolactone decarboxylase family protein [Gammaproteobacteria bacterium]|nr:carboxymuconolactone decarboxylase family protein [Gammaproteobacteria bacterium]